MENIIETADPDAGLERYKRFYGEACDLTGDSRRRAETCIDYYDGNQLTREGDDRQVANARAVIDELVELVEGGHQIG